jgi:hypothetical protein
MTLLSILNERQALTGNRIVQTMLESVAATTNATQGELIDQALPHEIGGRKALLDRFGLKIHMLNVSENFMDEFLLVENVKSSKNENKFIVVDLRGLRPLLNKIQIPEPILEAMTDVTLHMDRQYTSAYNEDQSNQAADGNNKKGTFYPTFSGSNRSQSKVIKFWKASFLARQIMQGVEFSDKSLEMLPKDLVDVAPALLQGGPGVILPSYGLRIPFVLFDKSGPILQLRSMEKNRKYLPKYNLNEGFYDPYTQIFQYKGLDEIVKRVKFDPVKKVFISANPKDIDELVVDMNDVMVKNALGAAHPKTLPYINLVESLSTAHNLAFSTNNNLTGVKKDLHDAFLQKNPHVQYQKSDTDGKIDSILESAPLARAIRKQLEEIKKFQDEFVAAVNSQIAALQGKRMTYVDPAPLRQKISDFKDEAEGLKAEVKEALESNDAEQIQEVAGKTLRQTFKEMSFLFMGAESMVKAIMVNLVNRKNLMIFGPPGSAKTMVTRMLLDKNLDSVKDAVMANANSVLSQVLLDAKIGEGSIFVKQFHPMSNEGDIVGRVDLAEVRKGNGYSYNRTGSLSCKDVLFALLDEFEKSPPGVRTALLSILNERQLMDGDQVVYSNIMAIIMATNSTPGQFIQGSGAWSSAFPTYDRITHKAYALNKMSPEDLKEFHKRIYLGLSLQLQSPLMLQPLTAVAKEYKLAKFERMVLHKIRHEFLKQIVDRREGEMDIHQSNPESVPDFFVGSMGESKRSAVTLFEGDGSASDTFSGAVLVNRILAGKDISEIRRKGFKFDLIDLEAFAELHLTYNGTYQVKADYDNVGWIYFRVVEKDMSGIDDRIDMREKNTFVNNKFEAELLVSIVNKNLREYQNGLKASFLAHPDLYPSAFATSKERAEWIQDAGIGNQTSPAP